MYREDLLNLCYPSQYWKLPYYCSMHLQVTLFKSLPLFKFIELDLTTHKPRMEFIICSYLNVNFLIDSNFKLQISLLILSDCLFHKVEFQVELTKNTGSAIDNIFICNCRAIDFEL